MVNKRNRCTGQIINNTKAQKYKSKFAFFGGVNLDKNRLVSI
ncbi:terminase (plasmid) [Borreliella burgdorferi]|nr:terminase [Borreliella burgdorferi]ARS32281.1 terminase [Borreliella burgdorferi]ARS32765.1 terminase [Borreliella burgdorferi]PNL87344.1 terminase [Borreliella burgdorferi]